MGFSDPKEDKLVRAKTLLVLRPVERDVVTQWKQPAAATKDTANKLLFWIRCNCDKQALVA